MQKSNQPNPVKMKALSKQQRLLSAAEENNRRNVELLFKALAGAGMYKAHTAATPRCNLALTYKHDEKLHSDLMLQVTVDICALAPSKKRVVCRIYELLEELDGDVQQPILGEDSIPREWLLQVLDRLSKPCDHGASLHNNSEDDPWMGLHLVGDCYDDLPMFALGSRELAELKANARREADRLCCDPVDEALKCSHLVSRYGLTVATDIVITHKRDGEKLMERKAHYVDAIWADTVRRELLALGANAHQPQDEPEELHMLLVKDQVALLMSKEMHLVHERAAEVDQRAEKEFPQK